MAGDIERGGGEQAAGGVIYRDEEYKRTNFCFLHFSFFFFKNIWSEIFFAKLYIWRRGGRR
jgi:hypothetical protein